MVSSSSDKSSAVSEPLAAPWAEVRAESSAQLYAWLRRAIRSGLACSGEPLPSERAFSAHLNLARKTVRVAIQQLADEGLICGDSTRIRRVADQDQAGRLSHTLALVDNHPLDLEAIRERPGWPTYAHVAALNRIYEHGYQALSCVVGAGQLPALHRLIRMRPEGVLLPFDAGDSPEGKAQLDLLAQARIAVVAHRDLAAVGEDGHDYVCTDHFAGGQAQAEFLLRRGCRRILRVTRWTDRPHWLRRRDQGFEESLRQAGVEILPVLHTQPVPVGSPIHSADKYELVTRMLAGYLLPYVQCENPIDALIPVTDGQTFETATAVRLLGRVPNKDVLVVGYDNSWATGVERQFESAVPAATVEKHYRQIGSQMVDLLLARLEGQLPAEPQRQIIRPTLMETDAASGAARHT